MDVDGKYPNSSFRNEVKSVGNSSQNRNTGETQGCCWPKEGGLARQNAVRTKAHNQGAGRQRGERATWGAGRGGK